MSPHPVHLALIAVLLMTTTNADRFELDWVRGVGGIQLVVRDLTAVLGRSPASPAHDLHRVVVLDFPARVVHPTCPFELVEIWKDQVGGGRGDGGGHRPMSQGVYLLERASATFHPVPPMPLHNPGLRPPSPPSDRFSFRWLISPTTGGWIMALDDLHVSIGSSMASGAIVHRPIIFTYPPRPDDDAMLELVQYSSSERLQQHLFVYDRPTRRLFPVDFPRSNYIGVRRLIVDDDTRWTSITSYTPESDRRERPPERLRRMWNGQRTTATSKEVLWRVDGIDPNTAGLYLPTLKSMEAMSARSGPDQEGDVKQVCIDETTTFGPAAELISAAIGIDHINPTTTSAVVQHDPISADTPRRPDNDGDQHHDDDDVVLRSNTTTTIAADQDDEVKQVCIDETPTVGPAAQLLSAAIDIGRINPTATSAVVQHDSISADTPRRPGDDGEQHHDDDHVVSRLTTTAEDGSSSLNDDEERYDLHVMTVAEPIKGKNKDRTVISRPSDHDRPSSSSPSDIASSSSSFKSVTSPIRRRCAKPTKTMTVPDRDRPSNTAGGKAVGTSSSSSRSATLKQRRRRKQSSDQISVVVITNHVQGTSSTTARSWKPFPFIAAFFTSIVGIIVAAASRVLSWMTSLLGYSHDRCRAACTALVNVLPVMAMSCRDGAMALLGAIVWAVALLIRTGVGAIGSTYTIPSSLLWRRKSLRLGKLLMALAVRQHGDLLWITDDLISSSLPDGVIDNAARSGQYASPLVSPTLFRNEMEPRFLAEVAGIVRVARETVLRYVHSTAHPFSDELVLSYLSDVLAQAAKAVVTSFYSVFIVGGCSYLLERMQEHAPIPFDTLAAGLHRDLHTLIVELDHLQYEPVMALLTDDAIIPRSHRSGIEPACMTMISQLLASTEQPVCWQIHTTTYLEQMGGYVPPVGEGTVIELASVPIRRQDYIAPALHRLMTIIPKRRKNLYAKLKSVMTYWRHLLSHDHLRLAVLALIDIDLKEVSADLSESLPRVCATYVADRLGLASGTDGKMLAQGQHGPDQLVFDQIASVAVALVGEVTRWVRDIDAQVQSLLKTVGRNNSFPPACTEQDIGKIRLDLIINCRQIRYIIINAIRFHVPWPWSLRVFRQLDINYDRDDADSVLDLSPSPWMEEAY